MIFKRIEKEVYILKKKHENALGYFCAFLWKKTD